MSNIEVIPPSISDPLNMPILETQNVTKTYTIGEREVDVLMDITLAIEIGEVVAIVGSSGSGKTTLLSLLSGLDQPSAGRVWVEGQDITDKSEDELAPLRNQTILLLLHSRRAGCQAERVHKTSLTFLGGPLAIGIGVAKWQAAKWCGDTILRGGSSTVQIA